MKALLPFQIGSGFLILALCSSGGLAQEEQGTPPDLSIVAVQIEQIPANQVPVGGSVAAHRSVILAAQLPGRVTYIAGQEGDAFKKGELLVKLNDDELRAKREAAQAQLASAAAEVHNANIQLSRQVISPNSSNQTPGGMGMPGMFDQMFTNPMASMMGTRHYGVERGADITSSHVRLEQAQHNANQARSKISQIDTKLRDVQSVAPFDGVIVKKLIEVGDTVQPGQTLLVFEDLSKLEIVVDVPNQLARTLRLEQQIDASVDGLDHNLQQPITRIFPTSDPVRHTTRVKIGLPDLPGVAPGNYAEVRIPVDERQSSQRLLIPASAVVTRGGIPSVFVVDEGNRTRLRLVRLGDELVSGQVVVLFGIHEGERVVDRPPSYLTSGRLVAQP